MRVFASETKTFGAVSEYGAVYLESISATREDVVSYIDQNHKGEGGWNSFLEKKWKIKPIKISLAS